MLNAGYNSGFAECEFEVTRVEKGNEMTCFGVGTKPVTDPVFSSSAKMWVYHIYNGFIYCQGKQTSTVETANPGDKIKFYLNHAAGTVRLFTNVLSSKAVEAREENLVRIADGMFINISYGVDLASAAREARSTKARNSHAVVDRIFEKGRSFWKFTHKADESVAPCMHVARTLIALLTRCIQVTKFDSTMTRISPPCPVL